MSNPYHEEYGLPHEKRIEVLKDAERLGIITAGAIHNVSISAIYRWQKDGVK
jgi:hypothetical protein